MGRPRFGKVRQAAYDAATKAGNAAQSTGDQAKKSMLQLTEAGLNLVGKLCEVADESLDGVTLSAKYGEKQIPITITITLKEDEE